MAASGKYIVESDVDNWPPVASVDPETFEIGAVDIYDAGDANANKITVVTNIATCTEIQFSSTGVVPAPLETGVIYYAINVNATHIRVAETPVLAAVPTPIELTDQGSGTHKLDIGSGESTTERQEVIDRAEQLIERITKDYFYENDFIIYRNGNDNDQLFLGLVPDIISVTEIKISGIVLTTSWYTNNVDSVYLDPEAETLSAGDTAELHLRLKYKRRLFPQGIGNIKITGTYGWESCPAAIKRAAIILCRYENDDTLYSAYSGSLKSEKLGDYSYTLSDRVSAKESTGVSEADNLIRNYIRKKPMLSAV